MVRVDAIQAEYVETIIENAMSCEEANAESEWKGDLR